MAVFSLEEILQATGGSLRHGGSTSLRCVGISTDTRTIKPGEAFLALKGERFDGHDYFAEAVERGAALLIGMRPEGYPPDVPAVRVPDTLKALGDLAGFHRRRFAVPVVAVTGSNGKTTTKEMTAAILGRVWPVVKTEKNFNNEIGLPLTLLRIQEETKACVVEMGMRGPGQIRALCRIALPTMGIVTNVGVTHIELLGSREAIAEAKGELAEELPADGRLILNADDPLVDALGARSKAGIYRFSLERPADLYLAERRTEGIVQRLTVDGAWGRFTFRLPALGRHNAANALAAALAGLLLGIDPGEVGEGLAALVPADQRLQLRETASGVRILDDTYNSSPPAVEAALEAMDSLEGAGGRIAVLGDMLELGEEARKAHAEVGKRLRLHRVDIVYTFGELSAETTEAALQAGIPAKNYNDMEELLSDLSATVKHGDLVLVKGSRGMRMERVVQALLGRNES